MLGANAIWQRCSWGFDNGRVRLLTGLDGSCRVLRAAHYAMPLAEVVKELPFTVPFGGLLGYCTGTMAAGVFLILDKFEAAHRAGIQIPRA